MLATQGLNLVGAIAIQSALARLLGVDGRGEYAILVLFGTAFPVLFTAGVDRASQYFSMSGKLPMWGAILSAATILMVGSAVAALIALPLIASDLPFFAQAPERLFAAALALFPLTSLFTLVQLHAAGKRQFRALVAASLVQTATQLACLGAFIIALDDDTLAALSSYALSLAVASTLLLYRLTRVEPPSVASPFSGISLIARYGIRYYAARIGNLVDLAMGTLLLAFVADTGSVGIFAAVSAIALKALLVAESIEATILPRIASEPHQRIRLVSQCYRASMLVTLVATSLLCALAPIIVPLLLSDAFGGGIALIWTMAPGIVLQGGAAMLMAYYRGANRPEVCSMAVWTGLCVNAVGFFALYPHTGLYAAGISMTLGLATRWAFLTLSFTRQNRLQMAGLLIPTLDDWNRFRHAFSEALSRFDSSRAGV